jgi:hypothetical protein
MKATVDIPDELYRQVKAKSALEGRPVREVVVELFQGYVGRGGKTGSPLARKSVPGILVADGKPAPPWFGLARKHIRNVEEHDLAKERASIERGWAQEGAESEAALRKPRKR